MIAVIGLGNPGEEFAGTRHNTGFRVVERLAEELPAVWKKEDKFQSLIARPDTKQVLLVKPQTYMNLSGEAVRALALFYKMQPADVWVIYDDVDLPVGTARSRERGMGRTRHKGVLSIAAALGTHSFPRFRVGVASAEQNIQAADRPRQPVALKDFVLQPFDKREQPLLEKTIEWTTAEVRTSLKRGSVRSHTLTKGASL